jgi:hypothetical protein
MSEAAHYQKASLHLPGVVKESIADVPTTSLDKIKTRRYVPA